MSLMLDVIWWGFVIGGILLFVIFIVFLCAAIAWVACES